MVEELLSYSQQDLSDLNELMHELSASSYWDDSLLRNAMSDQNTHVYVIRDGGHIVGTATLCMMHSLEFTKASIESVVVSSLYRGKGYGRMLMDFILSDANKLEIHHLHLTSNPKRIAANEMYRKIGFQKYETNCYKIEI